MITIATRRCPLLLMVVALTSCGGGGDERGGGPPPGTTLVAIDLSPRQVSLAPGGTQQLTVTGTYGDGTTSALAASEEAFATSDQNVATVSAAGVITVAADATAGETATIGATDTASGVVSAAAGSTTVTVVAAPTIGPTPNSASAATATVNNNPQCAPPSIDTAYYWEIGDASGTLVSGTHANAAGATLDQRGDPISADSSLWSIASASKWIYATYVIEARGSANIINQTDPSIPHLNFTSGFTYLGNSPPTTPCPMQGTVNDCREGLPSTPDPATQGAFYYDSDHMEQHAAAIMGLGDGGIDELRSAIRAVLGMDLDFSYSRPLLATGVSATISDYALFLRRIISGQYQMSATLSANFVCTNLNEPGCNAIAGQSPITVASNGAEAWHYSMGHWIEDDPIVGDGAFSSPGALGFYPWIDSSRTYYGIIARSNLNATAGDSDGYKSVVCGRLVRRAWDTGVEQTGPAPDLTQSNWAHLP